MSRFSDDKTWARDLVTGLPGSVASVEDAYRGSAGSKTIFLLQDAHANPSGQLNAARTLEFLFDKQPLKTVFLEAGSGDESLTFLRKQVSHEKLARVARSSVLNNKLQGSEQFSLSSGRDVVLWGVEDMALYADSIRAYRQVASKRETFAAHLDRASAAASALKAKVYNPELASFDGNYSKQAKKEMPIDAYLEALVRESERLEVPAGLFPHLVSLKKLKEAESNIDFERAGREFEAKSKSNGISSEAFPELAKYERYLEDAAKIDLKEALEEQRVLENEIFERLSFSDDEKTLVRTAAQIEFLKKLLDLAITPREYADYRRDKESFDITRLTGFLNRKIMDFKSPYERAVFLEDGFEDAVKTCETFYELTYSRDARFIKNMAKRFAETGEISAVLVVGGYHAPNLKTLLKEKGYSYVSLTPQILQETNRERYEKILLGSNIDKLPASAFAPSNASMPMRVVMQSRFGDFAPLNEIQADLGADEAEMPVAAARLAAVSADRIESAVARLLGQKKSRDLGKAPFVHFPLVKVSQVAAELGVSPGALNRRLKKLKKTPEDFFMVSDRRVLTEKRIRWAVEQIVQAKRDRRIEPLLVSREELSAVFGISRQPLDKFLEKNPIVDNYGLAYKRELDRAVHQERHDNKKQTAREVIQALKIQNPHATWSQAIDALKGAGLTQAGGLKDGALRHVLHVLGIFPESIRERRLRFQTALRQLNAKDKEVVIAFVLWLRDNRKINFSQAYILIHLILYDGTAAGGHKTIQKILEYQSVDSVSHALNGRPATSAAKEQRGALTVLTEELRARGILDEANQAFDSKKLMDWKSNAPSAHLNKAARLLKWVDPEHPEETMSVMRAPVEARIKLVLRHAHNLKGGFRRLASKETAVREVEGRALVKAVTEVRDGSFRVDWDIEKSKLDGSNYNTLKALLYSLGIDQLSDYHVSLISAGNERSTVPWDNLYDEIEDGMTLEIFKQRWTEEELPTEQELKEIETGARLAETDDFAAHLEAVLVSGEVLPDSIRDLAQRTRINREKWRRNRDAAVAFLDQGIQNGLAHLSGRIHALRAIFERKQEAYVESDVAARIIKLFRDDAAKKRWPSDHEVAAVAGIDRHTAAVHRAEFVERVRVLSARESEDVRLRIEIAILKGKFKKHDVNRMSTLAADIIQARFIRERKRRRMVEQRDIAEMFGVAESFVSKIWPHIAADLRSRSGDKSVEWQRRLYWTLRLHEENLVDVVADREIELFETQASRDAISWPWQIERDLGVSSITMGNRKTEFLNAVESLAEIITKKSPDLEARIRSALAVRRAASALFLKKPFTKTSSPKRRNLGSRTSIQSRLDGFSRLYGFTGYPRLLIAMIDPGLYRAATDWNAANPGKRVDLSHFNKKGNGSTVAVTMRTSLAASKDTLMSSPEELPEFALPLIAEALEKLSETMGERVYEDGPGIAYLIIEKAASERQQTRPDFADFLRGELAAKLPLRLAEMGVAKHDGMVSLNAPVGEDGDDWGELISIEQTLTEPVGARLAEAELSRLEAEFKVFDALDFETRTAGHPEMQSKFQELSRIIPGKTSFPALWERFALLKAQYLAIRGVDLTKKLHSRNTDIDALRLIEENFNEALRLLDTTESSKAVTIRRAMTWLRWSRYYALRLEPLKLHERYSEAGLMLHERSVIRIQKAEELMAGLAAAAPSDDDLRRRVEKVSANRKSEIEFFRRSIDTGKNQWLSRVQHRAGRGDFERWETLFESLHQLDPDKKTICQILAFISFRLGHHEKALAAATEYLQGNAQHSSVLLLRASIYIALARYAEAKTDAETAILHDQGWHSVRNEALQMLEFLEAQQGSQAARLAATDVDTELSAIGITRIIDHPGDKHTRRVLEKVRRDEIAWKTLVDYLKERHVQDGADGIYVSPRISDADFHAVLLTPPLPGPATKKKYSLGRLQVDLEMWAVLHAGDKGITVDFKSENPTRADQTPFVYHEMFVYPGERFVITVDHLKPSARPRLHWGINGWKKIPAEDPYFEPTVHSEGEFAIMIPVPPDAHEINFVIETAPGEFLHNPTDPKGNFRIVVTRKFTVNEARAITRVLYRVFDDFTRFKDKPQTYEKSAWPVLDIARPDSPSHLARIVENLTLKLSQLFRYELKSGGELAHRRYAMSLRTLALAIEVSGKPLEEILGYYNRMSIDPLFARQSRVSDAQLLAEEKKILLATFYTALRAGSDGELDTAEVKAFVDALADAPAHSTGARLAVRDILADYPADPTDTDFERVCLLHDRLFSSTPGPGEEEEAAALEDAKREHREALGRHWREREVLGKGRVPAKEIAGMRELILRSYTFYAAEIARAAEGLRIDQQEGLRGVHGESPGIIDARTEPEAFAAAVRKYYFNESRKHDYFFAFQTYGVGYAPDSTQAKSPIWLSPYLTVASMGFSPVVRAEDELARAITGNGVTAVDFQPAPPQYGVPGIVIRLSRPARLKNPNLYDFDTVAVFFLKEGKTWESLRTSPEEARSAVDETGELARSLAFGPQDALSERIEKTGKLLELALAGRVVARGQHHRVMNERDAEDFGAFFGRTPEEKALITRLEWARAREEWINYALLAKKDVHPPVTEKTKAAIRARFEDLMRGPRKEIERDAADREKTQTLLLRAGIDPSRAVPAQIARAEKIKKMRFDDLAAIPALAPLFGTLFAAEGQALRMDDGIAGNLIHALNSHQENFRQAFKDYPSEGPARDAAARALFDAMLSSPAWREKFLPDLKRSLTAEAPQTSGESTAFDEAMELFWMMVCAPLTESTAAELENQLASAESIAASLPVVFTEPRPALRFDSRDRLAADAQAMREWADRKARAGSPQADRVAAIRAVFPEIVKLRRAAESGDAAGFEASLQKTLNLIVLEKRNEAVAVLYEEISAAAEEKMPDMKTAREMLDNPDYHTVLLASRPARQLLEAIRDGRPIDSSKLAGTLNHFSHLTDIGAGPVFDFLKKFEAKQPAPPASEGEAAGARLALLKASLLPEPLQPHFKGFMRAGTPQDAYNAMVRLCDTIREQGIRIPRPLFQKARNAWQSKMSSFGSPHDDPRREIIEEKQQDLEKTGLIVQGDIATVADANAPSVPFSFAAYLEKIEVEVQATKVPRTSGIKARLYWELMGAETFISEWVDWSGEAFPRGILAQAERVKRAMADLRQKVGHQDIASAPAVLQALLSLRNAIEEFHLMATAEETVPQIETASKALRGKIAEASVSPEQMRIFGAQIDAMVRSKLEFVGIRDAWPVASADEEESVRVRVQQFQSMMGASKEDKNWLQTMLKAHPARPEAIAVEAQPPLVPESAPAPAPAPALPTTTSESVEPTIEALTEPAHTPLPPAPAPRSISAAPAPTLHKRLTQEAIALEHLRENWAAQQAHPGKDREKIQVKLDTFSDAGIRVWYQNVVLGFIPSRLIPEGVDAFVRRVGRNAVIDVYLKEFDPPQDIIFMLYASDAREEEAILRLVRRAFAEKTTLPVKVTQPAPGNTGVLVHSGAVQGSISREALGDQGRNLTALRGRVLEVYVLRISKDPEKGVSVEFTLQKPPSRQAVVSAEASAPVPPHAASAPFKPTAPPRPADSVSRPQLPAPPASTLPVLAQASVKIAKATAELSRTPPPVVPAQMKEWATAWVNQISLEVSEDSPDGEKTAVAEKYADILAAMRAERHMKTRRVEEFLRIFPAPAEQSVSMAFDIVAGSTQSDFHPRGHAPAHGPVSKHDREAASADEAAPHLQTALATEDVALIRKYYAILRPVIQHDPGNPHHGLFDRAKSFLAQRRLIDGKGNFVAGARLAAVEAGSPQLLSQLWMEITALTSDLDKRENYPDKKFRTEVLRLLGMTEDRLARAMSADNDRRGLLEDLEKIRVDLHDLFAARDPEFEFQAQLVGLNEAFLDVIEGVPGNETPRLAPVKRNFPWRWIFAAVAGLAFIAFEVFHFWPEKPVDFHQRQFLRAQTEDRLFLPTRDDSGKPIKVPGNRIRLLLDRDLAHKTIRIELDIAPYHDKKTELSTVGADGTADFYIPKLEGKKVYDVQIDFAPGVGAKPLRVEQVRMLRFLAYDGVSGARLTAEGVDWRKLPRFTDDSEAAEKLAKFLEGDKSIAPGVECRVRYGVTGSLAVRYRSASGAKRFELLKPRAMINRRLLEKHRIPEATDEVIIRLEEDPNHGIVLNIYDPSHSAPLFSYKFYPDDPKKPSVGRFYPVDLAALDALALSKGKKLKTTGRPVFGVLRYQAKTPGNGHFQIPSVRGLKDGEELIDATLTVSASHQKLHAHEIHLEKKNGQNIVVAVVQEDLNHGQVLNVHSLANYQKSDFSKPVQCYRYFVTDEKTGEGEWKPFDPVELDILQVYLGNKKIAVREGASTTIDVDIDRKGDKLYVGAYFDKSFIAYYRKTARGIIRFAFNALARELHRQGLMPKTARAAVRKGKFGLYIEIWVNVGGRKIVVADYLVRKDRSTAEPVDVRAIEIGNWLAKFHGRRAEKGEADEVEFISFRTSDKVNNAEVGIPTFDPENFESVSLPQNLAGKHILFRLVKYGARYELHAFALATAQEALKAVLYPPTRKPDFVFSKFNRARGRAFLHRRGHDTEVPWKMKIRAMIETRVLPGDTLDSNDPNGSVRAFSENDYFRKIDRTFGLAKDEYSRLIGGSKPIRRLMQKVSSGLLRYDNGGARDFFGITENQARRLRIPYLYFSMETAEFAKNHPLAAYHVAFYLTKVGKTALASELLNAIPAKQLSSRSTIAERMAASLDLPDDEETGEKRNVKRMITLMSGEVRKAADTIAGARLVEEVYSIPFEVTDTMDRTQMVRAGRFSLVALKEIDAPSRKALDRIIGGTSNAENSYWLVFDKARYMGIGFVKSGRIDAQAVTRDAAMNDLMGQLLPQILRAMGGDGKPHFAILSPESFYHAQRQKLRDARDLLSQALGVDFGPIASYNEEMLRTEIEGTPMLGRFKITILGARLTEDSGRDKAQPVHRWFLAATAPILAAMLVCLIDFLASFQMLPGNAELRWAGFAKGAAYSFYERTYRFTAPAYPVPVARQLRQIGLNTMWWVYLHEERVYQNALKNSDPSSGARMAMKPFFVARKVLDLLETRGFPDSIWMALFVPSWLNMIFFSRSQYLRHQAAFRLYQKTTLEESVEDFIRRFGRQEPGADFEGLTLTQKGYVWTVDKTGSRYEVFIRDNKIRTGKTSFFDLLSATTFVITRDVLSLAFIWALFSRPAGRTFLEVLSNRFLIWTFIVGAFAVFVAVVWELTRPIFEEEIRVVSDPEKADPDSGVVYRAFQLAAYSSVERMASRVGPGAMYLPVEAVGYLSRTGTFYGEGAVDDVGAQLRERDLFEEFLLGKRTLGSAVSAIHEAVGADSAAIRFNLFAGYLDAKYDLSDYGVASAMAVMFNVMNGDPVEGADDLGAVEKEIMSEIQAHFLNDRFVITPYREAPPAGARLAEEVYSIPFEVTDTMDRTQMVRAGRFSVVALKEIDALSRKALDRIIGGTSNAENSYWLIFDKARYVGLGMVKSARIDARAVTRDAAMNDLIARLLPQIIRAMGGDGKPHFAILSPERFYQTQRQKLRDARDLLSRALGVDVGPIVSYHETMLRMETEGTPMLGRFKIMILGARLVAWNDLRDALARTPHTNNIALLLAPSGDHVNVYAVQRRLLRPDSEAEQTFFQDILPLILRLGIGHAVRFRGYVSMDDEDAFELDPALARKLTVVAGDPAQEEGIAAFVEAKLRLKPPPPASTETYYMEAAVELAAIAYSLNHSTGSPAITLGPAGELELNDPDQLVEPAAEERLLKALRSISLKRPPVPGRVLDFGGGRFFLWGPPGQSDAVNISLIGKPLPAVRLIALEILYTFFASVGARLSIDPARSRTDLRGSFDDLVARHNVLFDGLIDGVRGRTLYYSEPAFAAASPGEVYRPLVGYFRTPLRDVSETYRMEWKRLLNILEAGMTADEGEFDVRRWQEYLQALDLLDVEIERLEILSVASTRKNRMFADYFLIEMQNGRLLMRPIEGEAYYFNWLLGSADLNGLRLRRFREDVKTVRQAWTVFQPAYQAAIQRRFRESAPPQAPAKPGQLLNQGTLAKPLGARLSGAPVSMRAEYMTDYLIFHTQKFARSTDDFNAVQRNAAPDLIKVHVTGLMDAPETFAFKAEEVRDRGVVSEILTHALSPHLKNGTILLSSNYVTATLEVRFEPMPGARLAETDLDDAFVVGIRPKDNSRLAISLHPERPSILTFRKGKGQSVHVFIGDEEYRTVDLSGARVAGAPAPSISQADLIGAVSELNARFGDVTLPAHASPLEAYVHLDGYAKLPEDVRRSVITTQLGAIASRAVRYRAVHLAGRPELIAETQDLIAQSPALSARQALFVAGADRLFSEAPQVHLIMRDDLSSKPDLGSNPAARIVTMEEVGYDVAAGTMDVIAFKPVLSVAELAGNLRSLSPDDVSFQEAYRFFKSLTGFDLSAEEFADYLRGEPSAVRRFALPPVLRAIDVNLALRTWLTLSRMALQSA